MTSTYDQNQGVVFLTQEAANAAQELQEAEARLEQVTREVEETKRRLTNWQNVLRHYQARNCSNGPDRRYALLSPLPAVDLWADEHGETVVLAELSAVMMASGGPYESPRKAYSSLNSAVRKCKRYRWQEKGVWRRIQRPETKRPRRKA